MEPKRLFKRKIYDRLLKWKQDSKGNSALLIEGARRIGKSTIVKTFALHFVSFFVLVHQPSHRPIGGVCSLVQ